MKHVLAIFVIALSGCAGAGYNAQQLLDLNKAMILGLKPPAFTTHAQQSFSIEVIAVDNITFDYELFSGHPREVLVTPGQRQVKVRCKGRIDGKDQKHDSTVTIDAQPGHSYQLQPVIRNRVCEILTMDISDKTG